MTPLNSILNLTEMLMLKKEIADDDRETLKIVNSSANQMQLMNKSLLDI